MYEEIENGRKSKFVDGCRLVDKEPKILDLDLKFLDSVSKLVDSWLFFVELRLTRLLIIVFPLFTAPINK